MATEGHPYSYAVSSRSVQLKIFDHPVDTRMLRRDKTRSMKRGKTRKVRTRKKKYMSDEAFAHLREALEEAVAFERGKTRDLNVTRI